MMSFDDQIALLDRLAETGLRVAQAVANRAETAGPDEDLNSLSIAHARAARSVRLTLLLRSRLLDGVKSRCEFDAQLRRAQKADRVERIVSRVIADQADDEDEAQRMIAETGDRLETDDIYGDVLNRPFGDLIADICRDLGLEPDWAALGQEAWAKQEAAWPPTRPLPLAGEGDPKGGGVSSVAANDLAAMQTPAEGGLGVSLGPMPPQSASLTAPPPAGEHASDSS